jgi:uncharacterized YccA/Bax inhibitor family protein
MTMSTFQSSNPFLKTEALEGGRFGNFAMRGSSANTMSLQGAVNASFILLGLCTAMAVFCWSYLQSHSALLLPALFVPGLLTLVLTFVAYGRPQVSPYVAPVVAIAQGAFVGAASVAWSAYAEKSASATVGNLGTGLVLQAALLTLGIAGGLLVAYTTRLIRPSQKFLMGVAAATMGLCLFSIAALVLSMFGVRIPYLWDNGPIGIAFAGFVVVLAAMNLLVDFDQIERGAANGAPKYMEWYSAIGLLVTVVWLYVSLLRLLAMLQRRN